MHWRMGELSKRDRKNRSRKWVIASTLILSMAVSGCSLLPVEEEVLQPPLVEPAQQEYQVFEVTSGPITKRLKGTATFESRKVTEYAFTKVTGKVAAVNVKKGDMVKKGDVLIQLDVEGLDITIKERERDLEQAKLALEEAKQSRDPQLMTIRLMELEIAQNKLDEAYAQMEGKQLIAQEDGMVFNVENLSTGDTVQLNRTYVTIVDPNDLIVRYSGPNVSAMQEVQVGMEVDITIGSRNNARTIKGRVLQTPSTAPPTDDTNLAQEYASTVFIEPDEVPPEVTIGAIAEISVITQHKENAIKVPIEAVGSYMGRTFVRVLDGRSIREVDVEKGIETSDEVEILSGLEVGQQVILQ